jgi:hypothetical protein
VGKSKKYLILYRLFPLSGSTDAIDTHWEKDNVEIFNEEIVSAYGNIRKNM